MFFKSETPNWLRGNRADKVWWKYMWGFIPSRSYYCLTWWFELKRDWYGWSTVHRRQTVGAVCQLYRRHSVIFTRGHYSFWIQRPLDWERQTVQEMQFLVQELDTEHAKQSMTFNIGRYSLGLPGRNRSRCVKIRSNLLDSFKAEGGRDLTGVYRLCFICLSVRSPLNSFSGRGQVQNPSYENKF